MGNRRLRSLSQLAVFLLILTGLGPALADERIDNEALNKIKIDVCEAVERALELQPGTVVGIELEQEHGKLAYEIEIRSEGHNSEINVDASTGEATREDDD